MPKFEHVSLVITSECNAHCSYCWANKFKSVPAESMSEKTADAAMEFINRYAAEGAEVMIFGGEPFLHFDLIEYLFNKNFVLNYTVFTNGSILNKRIVEFIRANADFLMVTLSLDGDLNANLKRRGYVYNKKLVCDVLSIRNTGVKLTVTEPETMYKDINYICNTLGALRVEVNSPMFFERSEKYEQDFREQAKRVVDDPTLSKRVALPQSICGALCEIGTRRIAISPSGDLYPCDMLYFFNKYQIGNVFEGINSAKLKDFLEDLPEYRDGEMPCAGHKMKSMELCHVG